LFRLIEKTETRMSASAKTAGTIEIASGNLGRPEAIGVLKTPWS
jgi:hypothetical protein